MVRLKNPTGVEVRVDESQKERLVALGYAVVEEKAKAHDAAPERKPEQKAPAKKAKE